MSLLSLGRYMAPARKRASSAYNASGILIDSDSDQIGASDSLVSGSPAEDATLAGWLFVENSPSSDTMILRIASGTDGILTVYLTADNRLRFYVESGGDTNQWASYDTLAEDTVYHFIFAMAGINAQLYINGVDALDAGETDVPGDVFMPYIIDEYAILGGDNGGVLNWGPLWYKSTYIDPSILANREKFAVSKQPIYLGNTGELPVGTAAQIYLPFIFPDFVNNYGSGIDGAYGGVITQSIIDWEYL